MRNLLVCGLGASLLVCGGRAEAAFGFSGGDSIWGIQANGLLAVGDVTGDGRDDLVALVNDQVHVYMQNSDATFGEIGVYEYKGNGWADYAADLQVGDVDGDGVGDIVVGGSGTLALAVLRSTKGNPGARRLEIYPDASYANGRRIVLADVDDDGRLDIVQAVPDFNSGTIRVWSMRDPRKRRIFGAPLSLTASTNISTVQVRDINGDHLPDLAAAGTGNQVSIYYAKRPGVFLPETVRWTASINTWFATGDVTGDGLADLIVSRGDNAPTTLQVHAQQSGGQFAATAAELATGDRPTAMQVTDIDGDGDDDLLVLHAGDGIGLYLRDAGTLQPEVLTGFYGGTTLAVGDLNSDGCKDIAYAVANQGLTWQYGTGCQQPAVQLPDMAVALAASRASVTVGLANKPGTTSIHQPLVELDLRVGAGMLQTGTLPATCAVQAQTTRSQLIDCVLDDLSPGATAALNIPVTLTGSGPHATLTARARSTSDTAETTYRNNVALRIVRP